MAWPRTAASSLGDYLPCSSERPGHVRPQLVRREEVERQLDEWFDERAARLAG
jgi:hypothetical protein